MDLPILRDENIFPDVDVLKEALKGDFDIFRELETTIADDAHKLAGEWRYYNDGKAWLYKALYKKKTVFWLSVVSTGFIVTFYFNEKNYEGVFSLPIAESIKEAFENRESVGKLRPLSIHVNDKKLIADISQIIAYKKNK